MNSKVKLLTAPLRGGFGSEISWRMSSKSKCIWRMKPYKARRITGSCVCVRAPVCVCMYLFLTNRGWKAKKMGAPANWMAQTHCLVGSECWCMVDWSSVSEDQLLYRETLCLCVCLDVAIPGVVYIRRRAHKKLPISIPDLSFYLLKGWKFLKNGHLFDLLMNQKIMDQLIDYYTWSGV